MTERTSAQLWIVGGGIAGLAVAFAIRDAGVPGAHIHRGMLDPKVAARAIQTLLRPSAPIRRSLSWCLRWGATDDEAARALPGDELLADADIVSTRAIGIDAPPDAIWPWLVQMGPGRGGAYTYDWIENLLGLGMHSADRILPQYQNLKVGDAQHLGRRGPVLRVAVLEPDRYLVLRSDDGNWVWGFSLEPDEPGTRLISRNRIATPGAARLARAVSTYVMGPGSLIMERKMLLGIKQRAEAGRLSAGRI